MLDKFIDIKPETLEAFLDVLGEAGIVTDGDKIEKLSKDFYWYSPVLKRQLEDKRGALVLKIDDLEKLKQIVSICYSAELPITLRGGATGNYGQCIPLCGGVILDLAGMDKYSIEDGYIRSEPGARLGVLEPAVRAEGYEFRCLPSTWVKSTFAGFLSGGSGGVGSISWGGIGAGDNIKCLRMLTVEEEPKILELKEKEAAKALHTYGTTGILVEIEMRLAPKQNYQQLIISSESWDDLLDWTDAFAKKTDIPKRLVTQLENPIPSYFKPLKKYLKEGHNASFLLVGADFYESVVESAQSAGLECVYSEPLKEPLKPPYITDYTWNHTTLWAIKANDQYTYLQCGWTDDFKNQFQQLRDRFPGEIFQHIEWTGLPKDSIGTDPFRPDAMEQIFIGGIPLVLFSSEERLQEIMDAVIEIGGTMANPHTFKLEEGGRHPDIQEKYDYKTLVDPKGLLNPGKLRDYETSSVSSI